LEDNGRFEDEINYFFAARQRYSTIHAARVTKFVPHPGSRSCYTVTRIEWMPRTLWRINLFFIL